MKLEKDINLLTPTLRQGVGELKTWYERVFPDRAVIIGETQRPPVRQLMKFCQGRLPIEAVRVLLEEPDAEDKRVTNCDGFNKLSRHNTMPLSHAVDLWVKVSGKVRWEERYYKPFGLWVMQNYQGILRWGGEWEDWYHLEEL